MSPYPDIPQDQPAEEAVHQVLDAERLANDAIAVCERRAAEMVNAARVEARRIAERTEERISTTHVKCMESTGRKIIALEEAEREIAAKPVVDESGLTRMREVVSRLSAILTGGGL